MARNRAKSSPSLNPGSATPTSAPISSKQLLQRYQQAIRRRESGKGLTAAARKSIEEAITAGLVAARRLDVMVSFDLANDQIATARWQRDRRVGYRLFKEGRDGAAAPPAVPIATSSSPASGASNSTEAGAKVSDALVASEVTPPADVGASDMLQLSEAAGDAGATAGASVNAGADGSDEEAALLGLVGRVGLVGLVGWCGWWGG